MVTSVAHLFLKSYVSEEENSISPVTSIVAFIILDSVLQILGANECRSDLDTC